MKIKNHKLLLGAAAVFLLAALAPVDPRGFAALVGAPGAGEPAAIVVDATPVASLDPVTFDSAAREKMSEVFESLARIGESGRVVPALAAGWGSPDYRTLEVALRPGAIFHDGSAVTPEAVAAALAAHRAAGSPALDGIEVSATDRGVRFFAKSADPLLLRRIAELPIFVERDGEFFGTGPYRVADFSAGEISLEAFPGHWSGVAPTPTKKILRTVLDKKLRADALRAGDADLLTAVPPETLADLRKFGYEPRAREATEVKFLGFSLRPTLTGDENPFADPRVREAVDLAISRTEVAGLAEDGLARPATQFATAGAFGFAPGIEAPAPDLARARELLAEAGHPGGFFSEIFLEKSLRPLGEKIQADLDRAKIRVKLRLLSADDLAQKLAAGEAGIFIAGWRAESGSTAELARQMLRSDAPANFFALRDPELDAAIDAIPATLDPEPRRELLQKIMRRAVAARPAIPLFEEGEIRAVRLARS